MTTLEIDTSLTLNELIQAVRAAERVKRERKAQATIYARAGTIAVRHLREVETKLARKT